jgi:hypothetical protein
VNQKVTELKEKTPGLEPLQYWNKAAKIVVDEIKTSEPEKIKRFDDLAAEIRNSQSEDYTSRSPEVLKRYAVAVRISIMQLTNSHSILTQMQKSIPLQVDEWTRTTGAVFYTMMIYELPGVPGVKAMQ